MSRSRSLARALTLLFVAAASATAQYEPPSGHYDAATGQGATLKGQLYDIMRTGHIQRAYGDFRNSAILHDTDPTNPSNIILVYNLASVSGGWDSGATWNREHVWPQSRQPGSASNSTRGNLGDPHALRPANPGINSSRGNKPFGFADTTGSFGSQGSFYFPGDTDKGDIARSLFYSDTRWGPERGLALVSGFPSGNEMGDLDALIAWHYDDPPDDFEQRRNHVIATQSENPSFFTNNRNAYIDRPEFIWSVYVDQSNDTQLAFGQASSDGSSSTNLTLGPAFADQPVTLPALTLNKLGHDGTYFQVDATGDIASPLEGRHNAFPLDDEGQDERQIPIELSASVAEAGAYAGAITVDNLDVTTQGGPGRGSNDNDDTATITIVLFDRANASFDPDDDVNTLTHDFGEIEHGGQGAVIEIEVFNLVATPGFTAPLDLEPGDATGDAHAFELVLDATSIPAGGDLAFEAILSPDQPGNFTATYTINTFDDQTIPGASTGTPLELTLTASVVSAPCPGDCDGSGTIDFSDLVSILFAFGEPADPACDTDGSGAQDFNDLAATLFLFGPCE